jgi:hypothetical protein
MIALDGIKSVLSIDVTECGPSQTMDAGMTGAPDLIAK